MQTLIRQTQSYHLVKRESEDGRLSHAYLLLFSDARNLRTTLKEFAKILLDCDTSATISQQRRADLIDQELFSDCLFFPENGKKISVDDAEKIKEESLLSPVEGEKKLFVIENLAEVNAQTQNKLLKLLEEPPKGVYFLLGTTSVFPVLQTVLSRTKQLPFAPFSQQQISECLFRIYKDEFDAQTRELCASCADGIVGQAQNMLEGGQYKILLEQAFVLTRTPTFKLPQAVKTIGDTKYKRELLSLLRLVFRDVLLLKTQGKNAAKHLLLPFEKERLTEMSTAYDVPALLSAQTYLSEAEKQLNFNANFGQCIERAIAKIRETNEKERQKKSNETIR